jgi:hypothetical protein
MSANKNIKENKSKSLGNYTLGNYNLVYLSEKLK